MAATVINRAPAAYALRQLLALCSRPQHPWATSPVRHLSSALEAHQPEVVLAVGDVAPQQPQASATAAGGQPAEVPLGAGAAAPAGAGHDGGGDDGGRSSTCSSSDISSNASSASSSSSTGPSTTTSSGTNSGGSADSGAAGAGGGFAASGLIHPRRVRVHGMGGRPTSAGGVFGSSGGADVPGFARTRWRAPEEEAIDAAGSYAKLLEVVAGQWQGMSAGPLLRALHRAARLPADARRVTGEAEAYQEVVALLTTRFTQLAPDMDLVQLATALHTYARLRLLPGDQEFTVKLAQRFAGAVAVLPQPRHAPELAWALAVLGIGSTGLMTELSQAVTGSAALLDTPHLRLAAWAFATAGHYDWAAFNAISKAAATKAQEMDMGSLAALMWAMGAVHHVDELLCEAVAEAAIPQVPTARIYQSAQLMHAYARLRFDHQPLFAAIAAAVAAPGAAVGLAPQHVANLAWAFAVRRTPHLQLYAALAERALQLQPSLLPHHASIIAWSFARQGVLHEALMTGLAQVGAAAATAGALLPQNASNLAVAYGQLGVRDEALCAALAAFALSPGASDDGGGGASAGTRLRSFNTQNLSDLARGLSTLGYQNPPLYEAIIDAALPQLPDASPHSVTDLAWAAANSRQPAPGLFEAAARQAAHTLTRYSVRMLADLLWACAAAGHQDGPLLAATSQLLPQRLEQLRSDTESQAKLLWAFRQLGWRDAELEAQLAQVIPDVDKLLA